MVQKYKSRYRSKRYKRSRNKRYKGGYGYRTINKKKKRGGGDLLPLENINIETKRTGVVHKPTKIFGKKQRSFDYWFTPEGIKQMYEDSGLDVPQGKYKGLASLSDKEMKTLVKDVRRELIAFNRFIDIIESICYKGGYYSDLDDARILSVVEATLKKSSYHDQNDMDGGGPDNITRQAAEERIEKSTKGIYGIRDAARVTVQLDHEWFNKYYQAVLKDKQRRQMYDFAVNFCCKFIDTHLNFKDLDITSDVGEMGTGVLNKYNIYRDDKKIIIEFPNKISRFTGSYKKELEKMKRATIVTETLDFNPSVQSQVATGANTAENVSSPSSAPDALGTTDLSFGTVDNPLHPG